MTRAELLTSGLAERWRLEAEGLRRRGANEAAQSLLSCAEDLEVALTEWELEQLSVPKAAAETGKSKSQIWRDVEQGRLAKVDNESPIRVRRGDVIRLHPPRTL